jgi:vancomycin resistance protein YoaR
MIEVNATVARVGRWSHAHTFVGGTLFALAVFLVLVAGVTLGFVRMRAFLPGTHIAGVDVSWLDGESAAYILAQQIGNEPRQLELYSDEQVWLLHETELELEYDLPATINQAWAWGREGSLWQRLGQIQASLQGRVDHDLAVNYNEVLLKEYVASISAQLNDPAITPSLRIIGNNEVKLEPGKDGLEVDEDLLYETVLKRFSRLSFSPQEIKLSEVRVTLDPDQADAALQLGRNLLERELTVKAPQTDDWVLTDRELISLLSLNELGFSAAELESWVADYSQAVNRPPQNAAFQFVNGRVEEFRPGKDGLEVDQEKLLAEINLSLERLQRESVTMEAPVNRTVPEITTESVNNLGIREQLGSGDSTYFGSIPNRIYNIDLTSARLNGTIVKPGETFSFNNTIGDISAATGFKPAYIISGGRTILGDGGGVCQVSTTLFRAALSAGLPIVERKAHAYRVGYYEQNAPPGIDATVYSPTVDFKFKNDTPAHILIQAHNDPVTKELVINIYGTDDGRVVEMSQPAVWGYSPAPPPLYQDDPNLAPGQVKQIDWAAAGAKTSFDYKVTRNDEILFEKTFYSTFRPWQAVYLRGPEI